MVSSSVTYLIFEDAYYTSADLIQTIRSLRPSFQIVAVVEEEREIPEVLAQERVDFIIADADVNDGRIINIIFEYCPQIPVILISCHYDYAAYVGKKNIKAFLLKPVTAEALKAALPTRSLDDKHVASDRIRVNDTITNY